MALVEMVRCPNCGAYAERHHLPLAGQVKTECEVCDYLLILDTKTGQVVEFHAPGTDADYLYMRKKRLFVKMRDAIAHKVLSH
ncbi:MAG: replication restart DNA helicase PriA [Pseudanabaenaceae cyanobacterium SKYGB_i_bin29]|nr:replication restart DNA helicase PriA [Pseudanabaenaceae cyanobacterium SKYG29]MDW8421297.1 replication restart DNA helicase PriA [Pseudanabaenaceae cyanobacterium SKYGB_i_bin29]